MTVPLEGIKVIDASQYMAGPMAGRLLADWGADVIKVENPLRGDFLRAQNTLAVPKGVSVKSDVAFRGENHNRNKRSITLDLAKEGGREVIYKLLGTADIFISTFRPRELKKFSLKYDVLNCLNPRLIDANICGYGIKGAERDLPGSETTAYFSRSGVLSALIEPGVPITHLPSGTGLGDNVTGLCLAYGILLALLMRQKTGRGQKVDTSIFQTGVFACSNDVAWTLVTGQDRKPIPREDILNALTQFYQTKDGRWLRLTMMQADVYWSKFCTAIERQDLEHDPRFETIKVKMENHTALLHFLDEVFSKKTLAEWKIRLDESGVPWSPVQKISEVVKDPQAIANGFFVDFDHPTHGRVKEVANPITLSEAQSRIRMPAPEFGQHTEEILLEYGYTWDDISRFKEKGVIF